MKYQSKLRMILDMEEKKEEKIKEDLRTLATFKETIVRELEKEEASIQSFYDALGKGETVSSSFFSRTSDRLYRLKKEEELQRINQLILFKKQEYQQLKKKMERMRTLDAEREKAFYKEIEKKEERAIEELKTMMKHLEKGGE